MKLTNLIRPIIKYIKEDNLKHDTSYFDDSGKKIKRETEFKKYSVDDGLTVYYKDNVDVDTIKDFLKDFKSARAKIENRFKLKLGRMYKDPDASYEIQFGNNVVFDNDDNQAQAAEYVRVDADHSPSNSFYFNFPKVKAMYDDAIKHWVADPDYKKNTARTYNISKIEDMIVHEIAHALYFQQPLAKRKEWKEYYDNNGWENATSLYGQESDTEMFAETVVDIVNNETHQITKDLLKIFNL